MSLICGRFSACYGNFDQGLRTTMHRFIAVTIVMFAIVVSYPARAEVLIGAAGAITGKLAWIGEQLQRGAEMAVTDINAAGGVRGQQVRLTTADDVCDPEQAVAAAKKLVADGVVLVVGHNVLWGFNPGIEGL